jgi:hypothetical protein
VSYLAGLPVQQAMRVEFFINLKTAKALSITSPLSLLGRADDQHMRVVVLLRCMSRLMALRDVSP